MSDPAPNVPDTPIDNAAERVFNAAYLLAFPKPVRDMMAMPITTDEEQSAKWVRAHDLANQGYIIDVPIMVWNWNPFITMTIRQQDGYPWVPSANQPPIRLGPGVSFPGIDPYDPNNPPEGSIRVTTFPLPPASDIAVIIRPFGDWPRKRAADGTDGVGAEWDPLPTDFSPVGSTYQEGPKGFSKVKDPDLAGGPVWRCISNTGLMVSAKKKADA